MARPLTDQEKLRYPWASQITDYVPVGRLRRWGALLAVTGLGFFVLGVLAIYVVTMHVRLRNGLPHGTPELIVWAVSMALMSAGFVIGVVTAAQALAGHARLALLWSLVALIPLPLYLSIAFL